MSKNVLLLHIGMGKCGTSSLQNFLYKNSVVLEKYGWCYPDIGGIKGMSGFHSEGRMKNGGYFLDESRRKFDLTSDTWEKAWNCVIEKLEKYNVILSAEEISKCVRDDTLKQFLIEARKKHDNIKVLLYLRRQDRILESHWNQVVKYGLTNYKFHEYITCPEDDEQCYFSRKELCYYDVLETVSDVVGKNNTIVRVFEKQQLEGSKNDVISDFLSVIDLQADGTEFSIGERRNERIHNDYLEIKRIFNSVMDTNLKINDIYLKEYCEMFMKISKSFPLEEKEEGYFSKKERIDFLKDFEEQNKRVAREYLGREDGVLFYDNKMDYPQYISQTTAFEENIIRTFAKLIDEQNKKLDKLQNYVEKNFLELQKKERKLVYFGAGGMCEDIMEKHSLSVDAIIDNDESKSGMYLKDVEIISAKDIQNWSEYFVIITCMNTKEIEKQLQLKGLTKDQDYILGTEFFGD